MIIRQDTTFNKKPARGMYNMRNTMVVGGDAAGGKFEGMEKYNMKDEGKR